MPTFRELLAATKDEIREVDTAQAEAMRSAGATVLDVREPDEVATGTLRGAVNIPVGQIVDRLDELDPSRPVVLLCRSGGRSTQVAKFLTAQGFDDVVNLAGGLLAYTPAT